jgi:hypothetical protein
MHGQAIINIACLITVNAILIVLKEIRPGYGFEKADACRLIGHSVVFRAAALSSNNTD